MKVPTIVDRYFAQVKCEKSVRSKQALWSLVILGHFNLTSYLNYKQSSIKVIFELEWPRFIKMNMGFRQVKPTKKIVR